jgi:phytoene dehydrogenase-like protein
LQHNGLVAATLLARQGLSVEVFEEKDIVGGACRTEYPFSKAPGLPQSTGGLAQLPVSSSSWRPHHSSPWLPSYRRSSSLPACPHPAGAYLLGVMPPELLSLLQLDLPLRRRDPHYFLPTPGAGGKYLLFGSDAEATRQQFVQFFSEVGHA